MFKIVEDLGGLYVWGQYDLLVLLLFFFYGGMENFCFIFVIFILLVGDKLFFNVIVYEIFYSWIGNLVINKIWDYFWLNEGYIVYLECYICG